MMAKVLKIVWVFSCVLVLVVTLLRYAPGSASDIGVFLLYSMLFLAFPVSLLVAGLFALLAWLQEQLGVPLLDLIGSTQVGFSVMWLAFFVAGYWQWFILAPRLWRKWTARRARSAATII